MYRINLHSELFEARAQRRRRVVSVACLSLLTGVGILLVLVNVVNGFLIRERRIALESRLARTEMSTNGPDERPELAIAKQLLAVRRERIEWSPKLASLAARLGPEIRLLEVKAEIEHKGVPAYLEIQGVVRRGGAETESVLEYMDALGEEPSIGNDLPDISLGKLEGDGSGRFRVLCQRRTDK